MGRIFRRAFEPPVARQPAAEEDETAIDTPVPFTLKARYVFPVTAPPVPDGAVTIQGERILAVGRHPSGGPITDLGNVAILPGLVNAHTHLDLSDVGQPLGTPGIGLPDWIRKVLQWRQSRPLGRPVELGLRQSVRLGVTSLGEIAQPDWPTEALAGDAVDATVFLELIAPTRDRVEPALELARQHVAAGSTASSWRPGLSPHAPYSVHPDLLAGAISISAAQRVPIAFHLAESREELELLRFGGGPLRDLLIERGAWQPGALRCGLRPLDYLRALSRAHRALVIHGNHLEEDEIALLAEHRRSMAVVYCPRTHAWFQHAPYPLAKMLAAGVSVALGTDSRASAPDLSVLEEIRFVARQDPPLDGAAILQLGTIRAAAALGRDRDIGSLEAGKHADLAVVALPDHDAADPHELLLRSNHPVMATWFRGRSTLRWG